MSLPPEAHREFQLLSSRAPVAGESGSVAPKRAGRVHTNRSQTSRFPQEISTLSVTARPPAGRCGQLGRLSVDEASSTQVACQFAGRGGRNRETWTRVQDQQQLEDWHCLPQSTDPERVCHLDLSSASSPSRRLATYCCGDHCAIDLDVHPSAPATHHASGTTVYAGSRKPAVG
jgi:hypothetical protein